MIRLPLVLIVAAVLSSAAEPTPIHLWPHGAPGEAASLGPEKDTTKPSDKPVAGRPVIRLGDVSDPTITVYRASKPADTHSAVIVFPGGGYQILAMNIEGTEICQWLNAHGITAVLLKYRYPRRKGLPPMKRHCRMHNVLSALSGNHACEWKIAPERIGVMGFSAGGNLAGDHTRFNQRAYENVDEADNASSRPDFAVLIYPAYLTQPERQQHDRAGTHHFTRGPTTFHCPDGR